VFEECKDAKLASSPSSAARDKLASRYAVAHRALAPGRGVVRFV